uniref:Uncharacterized protein n=1 Tax=Alexandrium andersonii TaxID=327968 RepID=A0A7S2DL99_9DINO
MKFTSTVLIFAASFTACGCSPIGKVVQLLSDLQAKIVSEGEEAHKVYSEFAEFCEDRSKQLGFAIKTSKAEAEELKAAIAKETALSASLGAKIDDLAASIASDDADLKAATEIRAKEAADFGTEEKELTEVIDMLGRAIGILEREMQKGGSALLQVKEAASVTQALTLLVQASVFSSKDAAKLTALVQASQKSEDDSADAVFGAPAAAVYEGHSGDIISTLEGLLDKAESQLAEARKKETSAMNNFALMKQSLEDEIKFANKDMSEAKQGLAKSGEAKAAAEGDLEVTTKDLNTDTATLADLHKDCMAKAQDYEAATMSRGEELNALAQAKKVIQDTTGGAGKVVYGLNQVSFVQLGRSQLTSSTDLAKFEAVRIVRDLARQQHSAALAQLASRAAAALRSSDDPFGKVKGLISDMIAKLEDEAAAEASHKAYCDKELAEASAKKAEKESEIEKLTTKIDQASARAAKLKEEVAALQNTLAELASAQAEMDKMRSEEHEAFVKAEADLKQGLEGVKLALKVLREYYGAEGAAHAAAVGAGQGIIGLLEVVESDLSKSLAEATASEESAAAAYESETKENEVEKVSKEQDVKYKTKEASDLDKAVAETSSDRSAVQEELDAVLSSLKALNKECVAKAETYEERKARRDAEIAGLKEALSVLENEAALIQKQSRRTLRGHRQTQHVLA